MNDPTPETTEHLSCPWCQYDLFGLPASGNVVRCPECGNRSDLRLLRMRPEDRERRIRGMETLPATCAVSGLFSVCFGCLSVEDLAHSGSSGGWLGEATICGLLAASWGVSFWVFLRRYCFVVGASRVLALFHLCAALFLVGAGFFLGVGAMNANPGSFRHLATVFLGLGTLALGWWAYKRGRGILRQMYRQLAGTDKQRNR